MLKLRRRPVVPGRGGETMESLVGTTLGHYELVERLGGGGMGAVYLGRHRRLGLLRAIKVMLPEIGQQAEFRTRFEREAVVLARLRHPNIVQVFDFGDE